MDSSNLERLCVDCASELEAHYGDTLVEHVQAALRGGDRSGPARQMDMLGDLSAMSSIASLLVSMIGTVMTYIQLKQPNGAPPTAAAAAPQVIINADIITINVVLEDAIGDLGQEDRLIAKQLQAEVNKWLISRSTT